MAASNRARNTETTPRKTRFSIVGGGWRAEFFLRVVAARPDLFEVPSMYVRNPEKAEALAAEWTVPVHTAMDAVTDGPPVDFVVTSVPRTVNPDFMLRLVQAGLPVLSETPPAEDLPALTQLYEGVQAAGGRVQVAEQYHLQPQQAARLAVARSGRIGEVSQAQVSVGHGYHGVSLIRRYLGARFESPRIRAMTFTSPMIAGAGRGGPPEREERRDYPQTLGWLEFPGKLGVFDFVGSQYFGWIRGERVLVRGDRGEIANNAVSYLRDFRTPLRVPLQRVATGSGSNLEGYHLKGYTFADEWIYTNPLAPARLSGDEIAVGSCLLRMKHFVDTGEEFYSLAEACQDHYLSLLLNEAASSGDTLHAEPQVWREE
jgi:hypothetical protein